MIRIYCLCNKPCNFSLYLVFQLVTLLTGNFRPVINSRLHRNLKDFLMAFFAMIAIGVGAINHSPLLLFLMNTCFWLHTSLEIRCVTYECCLTLTKAILAKGYPAILGWASLFCWLICASSCAANCWQGLGRELQGNPHGRTPWDACDSHKQPQMALMPMGRALWPTGTPWCLVPETFKSQSHCREGTCEKTGEESGGDTEGLLLGTWLETYCGKGHPQGGGGVMDWN